jgi:DNA-binding XRE family transcriptional regulator
MNGITAIDLAARVKAWRGKIPARIAAGTLGISKRTLDGIEQGRGFRYPQLLLIAMRAIRLEGGNAK